MKKYDVFISYSRKDSVFAEEVCAVFDKYKRHYKFEYFFDREAITSEHDYIKRISKSIAESQVMLFLASKHSTSSGFCLKELLFADKKKVHIHQYRIDNSELPDDIDMLLGNHHYREYKDFSIENMVREVLENSLDCVIKSLNDLSKSREEPVTTPNEKPITVSTPAPTPAKTYKVGDYYNDGKKEGVVFWVDESGEHGKIVSMQQSEKIQWAVDHSFGIFNGINPSCNQAGTKHQSDGMHNMQVIKRINDWRVKYPAFAWCTELGDSWYLPAMEELKVLLLNNSVRNDVNKGLENRGATKMFNRGDIASYWSSTEDNGTKFLAWVVTMNGGYTYNLSKDLFNYVRAVSAF